MLPHGFGLWYQKTLLLVSSMFKYCLAWTNGKKYSRLVFQCWYEGLICKLQTYGINGKLLNLMQDYLHSRQQRVVLSRQTSFWEKVLAVIPKGSVLGPLLFFICRNNIPERIKSICKIFADDTSLFSIVKKDQLSQNNSDLKKISEWAHQWKMLFNPDPRKQASEFQGN